MFHLLILNSLAMTIETAGYYAGAILVFGLMIFVHELGHFLTAKKVGVGVNEFSIGFGPKIMSRQKGDTVYSWRAIPLGGYVRLVGEDAEESDPDDPRSFQNKSFAARIATVAAGPVMNYCLAFVIFLFLFLFIGDMTGVHTTELGRINPGYPADKSGLKRGDIVLSINGEALRFDGGLKMKEIINSHPDKEVEVTLNRDGEEMSYKVTPNSQGLLGFQMCYSPYFANRVSKVEENSPLAKDALLEGDRIVWIGSEGNEIKYNDGVSLIQSIKCSPGDKILMGIKRKDKILAFEFKKSDIYTLTEDGIPRFNFELDLYHKSAGLMAPVKACKELGISTVKVLSPIVMIVRKEIKIGVKDISGPIGIIAGMGEIGAYSGIWGFIYFAAILNIVIGIFNLFPIPALDGMRIVFLFIGAIRRKTVDQKIEGMVHFVGLCLLFLLMIVVTFSDITKLWRGEGFIPK